MTTATPETAADPTTFRLATVAVSSLMILALYGAVAFPFRYYLRRRPVGVALTKYLISTGIIFGLAAVVGAVVASIMETANPVVVVVGLIGIWAFFTVIAFAIYGVLAGQRALARFNANLRRL